MKFLIHILISVSNITVHLCLCLYLASEYLLDLYIKIEICVFWIGLANRGNLWYFSMLFGVYAGIFRYFIGRSANVSIIHEYFEYPEYVIISNCFSVALLCGSSRPPGGLRWRFPKFQRQRCTTADGAGVLAFQGSRRVCRGHLSSVQNPVDIPWNPGWFIGILILAYYNQSPI